MANTTSAANKTSGNNKKGGFKWWKIALVFLLVLFIRDYMSKKAYYGSPSMDLSSSYSNSYYSGYSNNSYSADTYSYDDTYSFNDTYVYEDSADFYYTEDSSNYNSNNVVGIWYCDETTIAIYDTGYAEVSSSYENIDYSWTASDTMLTFVPYDRMRYEPVTMYYEISGDTMTVSSDGDTAVMYR